jgi:hypothetical protein
MAPFHRGELIALAKDISAANVMGVELGLSAEELAFYDALAETGSAKALSADAGWVDVATRRPS